MTNIKGKCFNILMVIVVVLICQLLTPSLRWLKIEERFLNKLVLVAVFWGLHSLELLRGSLFSCLGVFVFVFWGVRFRVLGS